MKGQYFSFDAVIGASIFILTLVAIMSYWYGVSSSIEQQQSVLAKEAIRIADILYSPSETPYGITGSWSDKRLNLTKINELCDPDNPPPADVLKSSYGVAIDFNTREKPICTWSESGYSFQANQTYKMRRVGSVYDDSDGSTKLGYVDIYVYERAHS